VAALSAVVGISPTARQSGFRVDRPTFVYVMTVVRLSVSVCPSCLSVHHASEEQSGNAMRQDRSEFEISQPSLEMKRVRGCVKPDDRRK
jgi:hypothetical protein